MRQPLRQGRPRIPQAMGKDIIAVGMECLAIQEVLANLATTPSNTYAIDL